MPSRFHLAVVVGLVALLAAPLHSADVVELDEENWDAYIPAGKEVDAIYGDYALRSDRLMAVIGRAVETRHANMTVQNVAGALIDFTRRDAQSDQLSCFYPHGGAYRLEGPVAWPDELPQADDAARLAFRATPMEDAGAAEAAELEMIVGYELADGADHLTVLSLVRNPTTKTIEIELSDGVRADGEFEFGHEEELNFWWCYDDFWRQAYGVQPADDSVVIDAEAPRGRRPARLRYRPSGGSETHRIKPGESLILERRIFAAADSLAAQAIARRMRGEELVPMRITVVDPAGPVADAMVRISAGEDDIGAGRTDRQGTLAIELPPGNYDCHIAAQGRQNLVFEEGTSAGLSEWHYRIPSPGYVEGTIIDETGDGVPCKVAFYGQGVADPNFGPDSAIHGVRNLWYTHDGRFRVELLPGQYEVLISRGPEYDAILQTIDVVAGRSTRIAATLQRTVDTTGWLSAELHSHSTPSGDNTASQAGRVLNLLAEHLEFIPCTEHQRISSYEPHLEHFGASHRVLTCPGIELTGSPLPINHQNAFPLILRERTQDGGAPQIHPNPEVQIARLAMWDDGSNKVVQINHPNIAQMIGDRDLDGKPDEGFRKMFYYADVIEVHPLQAILEDLTVGEGGPKDRGNTIINWMQMLNLGYRIPGVVNTDAHWNFHGSGWLRNYVRSSTDNPAEARLMDVCHALQEGHIVMTNGPFLTVVASSGKNTAGPGEDLAAESGEVAVHVRVQCPNWLDVNRVQVFINGRAVEAYNYTRRGHAHMFGNSTVKFDNMISLQLEEDAHFIVAAVHEGGQLGRVYGPERGGDMPIAVSNSIFIDVDGDGFTPNGDLLGLPLPVEADHRPTHDHDHRPPHRR